MACKDKAFFRKKKGERRFFSKKHYLCSRKRYNCQLNFKKMNEISDIIDSWYDQNRRDLPWRNTRDAYLIWLSEIILQQTRVVQGIDYYLRFVEAYPTVDKLAAASEDDILKLWQGLGYYSRARNLLKAARQVAGESDDAGTGEKRCPVAFPTKFDDLLKLKGVGRYTAAAVASFAADENVAVVDGNVYRVLSRIFDIETPIDSTQGQKQYQEIADAMLHDTVAAGHSRSSRHNQAMMEFGALHCTPSSPNCDSCPVATHCLSFAHGTVDVRPVKAGKIKVKERHLAYIIYIYKDTLWVHQRGAGDIWQGLWEFVLAEAGSPVPDNAVCILQKKHQLTHQTLFADFWVVKLDDSIAHPSLHPAIQSLSDGYEQVSWMEWQQRAVPRLIDEANKKLSDWF